MFISFEAIEDALNNLKTLHPFYGLTYLVCKLNKLPVGKTIPFQISQLETDFLKTYFKPNKKSERFYQVFKSSKKQEEKWLNSDYAGSSLQSIRTRGGLEKAFIHKTKVDWGWKENYVEILLNHLEKYKSKQANKISAFYLAIWLFREINFEPNTKAEDLIALFVREFYLTKEDKLLFDFSIPPITYPLFTDNLISWSELKKIIPNPPDVEHDESGALSYLEIVDVGPSHKMIFEPAERLNLIAGDNGLGKSFLLDCAWWALTGNWASIPAYPKETAKKPSITYEIASENKNNQKVKVNYDWDAFGEDKWLRKDKNPVMPSLCIYARVDGSFAVFDPARREGYSSSKIDFLPRTLIFSKKDVWNGYDEEILGRKHYVLNGLITDWVYWQSNPDEGSFNVLTNVLKVLSPPKVGDLGTLKPSEPIRIAGDSRKIPTIEHPYGIVPIVHASAGVQRIITLAYLLVWAWQEHKINSKAIKRNSEKRIVILIDEIEAHLHPQWQRSILPALLRVSEALKIEEDFGDDISLQLVIATHSPFVIGSSAPDFNPLTDKLFHIDLVQNDLLGQEASIEETDFVNYGKVGSWLMSDIFELRQDQTSLEAEKAIEKAREIQNKTNPSTEEIELATRELLKYLSDLDTFLPRWIAFAEKKGVIV